jgi:outer membrane receptor for ferric coprogen and ferric-rhodotorulic acid
MRWGDLLAGLICGLAVSGYTVAGSRDYFDIPAGDLLAALDQMANQSHVEFIYSTDDLQGLHTNGVRGELTAENAIHKLLEGTNLAVNVHSSGAILITRNRRLRQPSAAKEVGAKPPRNTGPSVESRQLEEIVVMGSAEGLVATRIETPLREIPQTISIIPSEQIRQQNDGDLADALGHTVGITVVRTDSVDESFYSRGFKITSFHVDGGAALFSVSGVQQLDSAPGLAPPFLGTVDLSEFDHIEVLRGADALFGSNGNPGATISLVRKHPLATPELTLDGWVGSWNNTRVEADATGPLGFDGALRGRVDALYTDRHYFYDISSFQRSKVFAVLDYDVTPGGLLSVGGSYQWDNAVPTISGLPRNQDGSDPHLPRSTALTFNWAEYRLRTGEFYIQLRQALGDRWTLAINTAGWNGALRYAYGTFGAQIDPLTGGFDSPPLFYSSPQPSTQREFTSDITLTGTQDWFGYREQLAIGVDYTRASTRQILDFFTPTGPLVANAFNYDPAIYVDPRGVLDPFLQLDAPAIERRAGLFGSLRFFLRHDLSVTTGARFSGVRSDSTLKITTPFGGGSLSSSDANAAVISPYGGVVYDISHLFSLYASYSDIYRSTGRGSDLVELKAAHGVDVEGGLKMASRDGSLNGSLVIYRIRQYDVPVPDAANPPSGVYFGNDISRGIEAELEGRLQPGWLISAGYTFNIGREADGTPLSSATPRHLLKLWSSKPLPGDLRRWTVGGELQAQSANSRSGIYCLDVTFCQTQGYFKTEQHAYALVNLRVGYQITRRWSAALSLNNVLDKVYYEAVSTPLNENWYGTPRNFLLRIDGRY